jgi:DNA-binding response OmpR family regulator
VIPGGRLYSGSRPQPILPIQRNPAADRVPPPGQTPVDVLHVEDDQDWILLVGRWLEGRGLKSLPLGSGVELRSYLARCTALPRCLLLDKTLPDADALTLCDEIKRSPSLQHLPVIVLTGDRASSIECLKRGALYCVQKGEGTEGELCAVLESILRQEERARGVIDLGDLRLDPRGCRVLVGGRAAAELSAAHFSALRLLVQSAPAAVLDERLYLAFIERRPYRKRDAELSIVKITKNYVSKLRHVVGGEVGRRLVRAEGGYAYRPAERGPAGQVNFKLIDKA